MKCLLEKEHRYSLKSKAVTGMRTEMRQKRKERKEIKTT